MLKTMDRLLRMAKAAIVLLAVLTLILLGIILLSYKLNQIISEL
jgi:hypothetical protein